MNSDIKADIKALIIIILSSAICATLVAYSIYILEERGEYSFNNFIEKVTKAHCRNRHPDVIYGDEDE